MKAIILSFIICCLITLCCIKLVPAPYFWAGIAWSFVLAGLYIKDRKKPKAALWFNLAFVVSLLTLAEFYFWA
ncbi:MAG TPA: hypothetical protein PLD88_07285, partial [Candidatus Berkiella sp.]|nr:hypothetical protein [Candidatus Berkiella sp.]